MKTEIDEEPALAGAKCAGADAIGGEPALADAPEAARDKSRSEESLREMWACPRRPVGTGMLLLLCAASGLFSIVCALVKGALGFGILAVVVGAPVVEETAKVVLPMMWLEKAPWRFRSVGAIVFACLASAFTFAMIENLVYFFGYMPAERLGCGIVRYRLTVCTAMHVGCAAISSCGLARAWRDARDGACGFSAATVTPYLVVAMVVHGFYNALATMM